MVSCVVIVVVDTAGTVFVVSAEGDFCRIFGDIDDFDGLQGLYRTHFKGQSGTQKELRTRRVADIARTRRIIVRAFSLWEHGLDGKSFTCNLFCDVCHGGQSRRHSDFAVGGRRLFSATAQKQ